MFTMRQNTIVLDKDARTLQRPAPVRENRYSNGNCRPSSSMHCGSRSGHDARLQPSGFLQLRTVAVLLFRASAARTYHSCGKTQSEMITQSDQTRRYVSQQQQFGTRRVRVQVRPILPLHEARPYSIPVCFCFCLCFYFCRQMDRSHRPHAPQRAHHKA